TGDDAISRRCDRNGSRDVSARSSKPARPIHNAVRCNSRRERFATNTAGRIHGNSTEIGGISNSAIGEISDNGHSVSRPNCNTVCAVKTAPPTSDGPQRATLPRELNHEGVVSHRRPVLTQAPGSVETTSHNNIVARIKGSVLDVDGGSVVSNDVGTR